MEIRFFILFLVLLVSADNEFLELTAQCYTTNKGIVANK